MVSLILLIIYTLTYLSTSRKDKQAIYSELNKSAVSNSIVFVGDSLTDFYRTGEFFLNIDVYNRGIASDTTDDILKRLDETVLSISPRKIFLQIGTNDLGNHKKPTYVINNIKKIVYQIQKALPNGEIYLISLYPVNSKAIAFSRLIVRSRKNKHINLINQELEMFAKASNLTYIDVASHLKDEKGNLKKEYTVEGLHISILGYCKISAVLKPYVV
mgnify:FL=1